jgi:8-hydroxy-5-deazaflavin:NADPH oxidoreductase
MRLFANRSHRPPENSMTVSRRSLFKSALVLAAASALPSALAADPPMKIGIIGSGRIGSALGELWTKAGHEVMFSSLDLEHDKQLAAQVGGKAKAGTPAEAAAFGDVILVSVPYKALPQVGRDYGASMKGKVVLDTCNPIPTRDGDMAIAAAEKGSGIASQELLPGAKVVRAFNHVGSAKLRSETHRPDPKVAVALAADDKQAEQVAEKLVRDAGFEPVFVGGLATAKRFDPGTPAFGKAVTADELRGLVGMK